MSKELEALKFLWEYINPKESWQEYPDLLETFGIIEAALKENEKLEEMFDNDEELIKTQERQLEKEFKARERLVKLHSDFRRVGSRRISELKCFLKILIDFIGVDNIHVGTIQDAYCLYIGNNYRQMKQLTEEEYKLFLKILGEYKI